MFIYNVYFPCLLAMFIFNVYFLHFVGQFDISHLSTVSDKAKLCNKKPYVSVPDHVKLM